MDLTWSRDAAVLGYLDALSGFREVAHSLTDEQWPMATDLPGWTVHDVVAHVNAIEDELAGRPVPPTEVDWALRPHATTVFQQYTEVGVEFRRGRSSAELVAELDGLVEERSAMLMTTPDSPDAEVRGPGNLARTVRRLIRMRTFDVWAHEADIRRTVTLPDRIDCPAGYVTVQAIVEAMPVVLAREVGAAQGSVVRWEIGAPFDRAVSVAVGDNGRGTFTDDGAVPHATIGCDALTLTLLACGRREPEALPLAVSGDGTLARSMVKAMTVTP